MVYYPLSMLMLAGIREILIISMPSQLQAFRHALGDGTQWGLDFTYAEQTEPKGLLILGDNIFFGQGLRAKLKQASTLTEGAVIFAYPVKDPERYGVVEFSPDGKAVSIEEKPRDPKSHYAVPGLYFYDNNVLRIAAGLKPSARGELEITDVNQAYLEKGELKVEVLGRGVAWLDAGTHESLLQAANFVQAVEDRQGMMISCPEEIAYRLGYIDGEELKMLALEMKNNEYGTYLLKLLDEPMPGLNAG
jgi:glucose-1-phosphate thymidylyltransferase